MTNVVVWNEFRHEQSHDEVKAVYPDGIHNVISGFLNEAGFSASTATLDEPEHGLTEEVLAKADVLVWWGHMAHHEVSDEIVARVKQRVLEGMGLIVLHSGHFSKIFKTLMGTTCNLKWREAGEQERIWVVDPTHPIASGIGESILLPHEEMYGEFFDIPTPDELVFISHFEGGEVFRSGCVFKRGQGKIFYFRSGHETHPTYFEKPIQQVITNAVSYVAASNGLRPTFGNYPMQK